MNPLWDSSKIKPSSSFSVKDKTEIKHKHNLVYKVTCPDCPANYIGEAGRRLQERVNDHGGGDKNSHVLRHSLERGHSKVKLLRISIHWEINFTQRYKEKSVRHSLLKVKCPYDKHSNTI
eukprot:TCONS_00064380-protein